MKLHKRVLGVPAVLLGTTLLLGLGAAHAAPPTFYPASACQPATPADAIDYEDDGSARSAVNGQFVTVQCPIHRAYASGTTARVSVYTSNDSAYTFSCTLTRRNLVNSDATSVSGSTGGQGNAAFSVGTLVLGARDVVNLTCSIPHSSALKGFIYTEQ